MEKSKNTVILSVIHHCQNSLEYALFIAYFSYFKINKKGLVKSPFSLSVNPFELTFECLNQSLRNFVCAWHMSPSQRPTSYILPISLCVCMCIPPIVTGQRLGKNITAATNTYATIELLEASFSIRSLSYQKKVGY
jgi:hypothetical protein